MPPSRRIASSWIAAAGLFLCMLGAQAADKPLVHHSNAQTVQPPVATLHGRIVGRKFEDHVIQGLAGQTLTLELSAKHRATSFVLLPPASTGAAMASGEFTDNQFSGVLPDDGPYIVRVFLIRAAARRGETGSYDLSVRLTGQPLVPVPSSQDALLQGTRFHAASTIDCQPRYTQARTCQARVVRREPQGSATVELTWGPGQRRLILFIGGKPAHADTSQPMAFTTTERGWRVTFDQDETYDIPQELVHGG